MPCCSGGGGRSARGGFAQFGWAVHRPGDAGLFSTRFLVAGPLPSRLSEPAEKHWSKLEIWLETSVVEVFPVGLSGCVDREGRDVEAVFGLPAGGAGREGGRVSCPIRRGSNACHLHWRRIAGGAHPRRRPQGRDRSLRCRQMVRRTGRTRGVLAPSSRALVRRRREQRCGANGWRSTAELPRRCSSLSRSSALHAASV